MACRYCSQQHDPRQHMRCLGCSHEWDDCPGGFGVNFKDGYPKCHSLYWAVTAGGTVT